MKRFASIIAVVLLSAAAHLLGADGPAAKTARDGERAPPGGWKLADFETTLARLEGRSFERGKQLFTRIHCIVCHPTDARKEFGPDLTQLDPRFQPLDILRDVLEPSRRIADARYDMWTFEMESGLEYAGLVASETFEAVKLMQQPPTVAPPLQLKVKEIERRRMVLTSMMPQRMLDELTRDEVADLIAYVAARGDRNASYVRTPTETGVEPESR